MAENVIDSAPVDSRTPRLSELFMAFAKISLSGFGGVLPWARRMMVDERAWMNAKEFNEVLALCQFLPGPNIVNFSVVFGSRARGVPGAIAALFGLLGPAFIIVLALGVGYGRLADIDALRRILAGLAAAAAGLIVATAAKMARPLLRDHAWPAALVAAAALVGVGLLGWPLLAALLGLAPVSVGLAWWQRR